MRIYGTHAVLAYLKHKPHLVRTCFIAENLNPASKNQVLHLAQAHQIACETVSSKTLDKWFPTEPHQGLALAIPDQAEYSEFDLPEIAAVSKNSLFLILDGIQDPHNLGACIRTAEAAGVQALIIPKDKAVQITPTVRKIACGAAEILPTVSVTNLARALIWLKEQGVWLIGTDMNTPQSLYQVDLTGPIGIVMGAEGTGLRALTKKHCDILAHIPMFGSTESLNVSVSTGICLYEAIRQRSL
ncbi:MAG: 23S rRNA (guanosine(2251)-2'-O)-methyltransferase RlmB [Gammaproteobacteria bacterium]